MSCSWGIVMLPTTYSTICRKHSAIFILGCHDLVAQKKKKKRKKKPQHMHVRHITFNGFTNICALWTVKKQKLETFPSRVRIHPWISSFWGLCLVSSVPARGPSHLLLERQTNAEKTICTYVFGPAPLLGEPRHLSACLQDFSGMFKVLTSSEGLCQ